MRLSEFQRAMRDEFGEQYGATILRDVVLAPLGDRTAREALAAGEDAKAVWFAVCEVMDVPVERRAGAGRLDPRRRPR